jgi:hypothetical protein
MKNTSARKPLPLAVERDESVAAIERCGALATASCAASADGGLWARTTPEAIAKVARDLSGTTGNRDLLPGPRPRSSSAHAAYHQKKTLRSSQTRYAWLRPSRTPPPQMRHKYLI